MTRFSVGRIRFGGAQPSGQSTVGLDRDRKLDEIRARLEQRISRLAQASDVASGTKGGGDLDSAPHHENETFAVPDASINDIVKRISGTSATAKGKPEADTSSSAIAP